MTNKSEHNIKKYSEVASEMRRVCHKHWFKEGFRQAIRNLHNKRLVYEQTFNANIFTIHTTTNKYENEQNSGQVMAQYTSAVQ